MRCGIFALLCAASAGCGVLEVPDAAIDAVAEWKTATGETDRCRVNAMEHCVAASAVASMCGESCALFLGRLLEIRQGDGDPMDLHNNQAGARDCALPIKSGTDGAVSCCEGLLDHDPPLLRTDGRCRTQ